MNKGKVLLFALLLVFATSISAGEVDDCFSTVSLSASPLHMLICPAGDFQDMGDDCGGYIMITVKDGSGNAIPGIPRSDYWVDACTSGQELYLCAGAIAADSLTNSSGMTTISDAISGGGCITSGGVYVAVQNVVILAQPGCVAGVPECLDMVIKSPDVSKDGEVGLADLGTFASAYGTSSGDALYTECCDFKDDNVIGLADLGYFAGHYGHRCQ